MALTIRANTRARARGAARLRAWWVRDRRSGTRPSACKMRLIAFAAWLPLHAATRATPLA